MQTANAETTSATSQRSPRKVPPWLRWLLLGLAGVLVVLAAALVVFRLARPGVLPGTEIAGIDVSNQTRSELESTIEQLATERTEAPLVVELDGASVDATAEEVGYRFETEATIEDIWRHGRQANPLLALGDHVRSLWDETAVRPVVDVNDVELDAWVTSTTEELSREPVEGEVSFAGASVERSDPQAGASVRQEELAAQVRSAILEPGADEFEAPHDALEPVSTVADIDAIVEEAELAVSAPVELVRNDGEVIWTPEELGELLTITSDLSGDAAEFGITADVDETAAKVSDDMIAAFEADPVSATFDLTSNGMEIIPSTEGFRFDAEAMRDQVLFAVGVAPGDDDTRRAILDGEILEPDRTTEEAEALQIVEPVASFTTNHACCQSRVTNIQRFADIVRGTVVEPGDVISLNEVVGERTRAKGFVGGGAIFNGEYIEDVGGGVSQFATTFFNAAYFGGYEIVDHKPHSYYISRYPVGRESTINWPNVDVKVRNNSPYGMYVHTSYTGTSISVTIYGKEWADVTSHTGSRFRIRQPETQVEINRDLAPGAEVVTQSGGIGFDIVVTRTIDYHDGETETEEFFTRYLPEPRIIERNPDSPSGGDGEA